MKRLRKAIPFLALVAAAVVIPVLASTLSGDDANAAPDTASGVDLDLILWVNRMELTDEQMQALYDALVEVVEERDALQTALAERKAAFKAEMLAFRGTSEELNARLEAYRSEIEILFESGREAYAAMIERLGDLLTYKQGSLLERLLSQRNRIYAGDNDLAARGASAAFGQPVPLQTPSREARGGFVLPTWGKSESSDEADSGTPRGAAQRGPAARVRSFAGPSLGWELLLGDRSPSVQGGRMRVLEELIRVLEMKLHPA